MARFTIDRFEAQWRSWKPQLEKPSTILAISFRKMPKAGECIRFKY
jgi:hypothetical protein